jgi:ABC-type nickel/cobalt efflux system permease component RcnA
MNSSIAATLGLGFLLGLRHALDADHLAAVSAIVSEHRSLFRAAQVGGLWGLGHTAALLTAGFLAMVLDIAIPERLANMLELGVAAMVIFLGARLLFVVFRGRTDIHLHRHAHGGAAHSHLHFHGAGDAHPVGAGSPHGGLHTGFQGWRPVLVGVVHGLAGSAAVTLLVLAGIARDGGAALGLAYLAVFGAGSIGGMAVMSAAIGLPFSLDGFKRALIPLRLLAGFASAAFGVVYAWQMIGKL